MSDSTASTLAETKHSNACSTVSPTHGESVLETFLILRRVSWPKQRLLRASNFTQPYADILVTRIQIRKYNGQQTKR